MKRFLSPAFFAVVVICFFLPFLSVSCNTSALSDTFGEDSLEGQELAEGEQIEISVTGFQIVTNQEPELEGLDDTGAATEGTSGAEEAFPGRIFAILALAAAVLGIGLSLMRGRIGPAASLVLGILGLAFLFLLRNSVQSRLGPAAIFGVEIGYKPGYWLALVSFLGAAGIGVWRLLGMRPPAVVPVDPAAAPPPMAPPGTEPPPGASPPGTEPPPGAAPPAEPPPP